MTAINTNVGALMSRTSAKIADGKMQTHMRRLSTGLRINSAADDAAGLAVSHKLNSQLKGINMGIRNSTDAISLLKTAEAGQATAINLALRMKEIAVQMSNGIYTAADRTNAEVEMTALGASITALSGNTLFNSDVLLDGTFSENMRTGDSTAETVAVAIDDADIYVATFTVSSTTAAASTATNLDAAIATLSTSQAEVGALINRLQFNVDNLSQASVIAEEAMGNIKDTDYAKETSELAKQQILNQAATSMLAQANQSKQSVLALLQ